MKIIAIDTEFNKSKKILSLGTYTEEKQEEFYFQNKVDKYTYPIHCLKGSFLRDYGEHYDTKNFNYIFQEYQYIIGFDIFQDLSVMNVSKAGVMYGEHKIIDLKIVLNAIGENCCLSSLIEFSNVDIRNSGLIHTSSFDAQVTYEAFLTLYKKSGKTDFSEFLYRAAQLTNAVVFGQEWEKEDLIYNYFNFKIFIDKTNLKFDSYNKFYKYEGFIYVYNKDICTYRFPEKYLTEKLVFQENKDIFFPKIGVKFKDNISGGL